MEKNSNNNNNNISRMSMFDKQNVPQWGLGIACIIMSVGFVLEKTNTTQIELLKDQVSDNKSLIAKLQERDKFKTELNEKYKEDLDLFKERLNKAQVMLASWESEKKFKDIELQKCLDVKGELRLKLEDSQKRWENHHKKG